MMSSTDRNVNNVPGHLTKYPKHPLQLETARQHVASTFKRTEAFPLDKILDKGFEKTAATNEEYATTLGFSSHVMDVAVRGTIQCIVDFFTSGAKLGVLPEPNCSLAQFEPAEECVVEQLSKLTQINRHTQLVSRYHESFVYDSLEERCKEQNQGVAEVGMIESMLCSEEMCHLKAYGNATRSRKFFKRISYARSKGANLLFLFRNSAMQWALVGDGRAENICADKIIDVYGNYMESLRYFPWIPDPTGPRIANRLQEFYIITKFPGAEDHWFAVEGTHWSKFKELADYQRMLGARQEKQMKVDNEQVLSARMVLGVPLELHLLLPREIDGTWRVTVAHRVETGAILGVVPGDLRYTDASEAESHWHTLDQGVYFIPVDPSPFSLIFRNASTEPSDRNVVLGYDHIQDAISGTYTSFRVFVVAQRPLNPLEPLSI
ncbi:hypothetical protein NX059_004055 [Plenodomus lindquistii]|nr:hypothetical protein NX059_004055 [Plenodomus lindquistii]